MGSNKNKFIYPICERVITKNGKVEYCQNPALFISPKGIFTKRIIGVCNVHKKDLIQVHKDHGKKVVFIDITYGHTPAAKENAN